MREYKDPLPHFVVEEYKGEMKIGTLLATRDGRRLGNGIVIDIKELGLPWGCTSYHIKTDFGNTVKLTIQELQEAFYEPIWISNVENWGKDIRNNHE